MSNPSRALGALLDRLGYPTAPTLPDTGDFGYAPMDPSITEGRADLALLAPLIQRGWLLRFDAEGSFMLPGEHTKLIQALLTMAGVVPLPAVHEGWESERGWAFAILDADRPRAIRDWSCTQRPSEWVRLCAMVSLLEVFLAEHTAISLFTEDQCAVLAILPTPVFERLTDDVWLVSAEDAERQPDPEMLLVESPGEMDGFGHVEELSVDSIWPWALR